MERLHSHIDDARVITLIWDYLNRTVQFGGLYRDIKRGISLGCPMSPLIGALYLKLMDHRMEKTGLFYVRFMDDWIVLSPNRWKLKKAILIVNQTLNELKVEKHPDKTFIGRIAKGFDFLGYSFEPKGLIQSPSEDSSNAFLPLVLLRLYEQGATVRRIGLYVRCPDGAWVRAGVVEYRFVHLCITPQNLNFRNVHEESPSYASLSDLGSPLIWSIKQVPEVGSQAGFESQAFPNFHSMMRILVSAGYENCKYRTSHS